MTRLHWSIIHRYHPRQDPLQAEGCDCLLLDSTYHMNCIKKGSVCTLQGIVNTFDDYKKALKNTLLNKSVIESPDIKFVDVTLKHGSKGLMYSPCTLMDYASIYGKA